MAWTSPATWVANTVLTAAQLNEQVRDNLKMLSDPRPSWTPSWTGSTTDPVIGNGTKTGGYIETGKSVRWHARIVMGSTTTYGSGAYRLSLPVAPTSARWFFVGMARDTSATTTYPISAEWDTSLSLLVLRTWPTTAGNPLVGMTPTVPFTLADTDQIFISGEYEAA